MARARSLLCTSVWVTRACRCASCRSLYRILQARRYSASTFLHADAAASMGNGELAKPSMPAAPAPAGSTTRIFFVQRPGAMGYAPLVARGDLLVGFLVEEVKKKLEMSAALDSITLQLASADGTLFTSKGADGNEKPVTLDSMATVDKALKKAAKEAGRTIKRKDKLRIIVDVAPAMPAARADGECGDSVMQFTLQRERRC